MSRFGEQIVNTMTPICEQTRFLLQNGCVQVIMDTESMGTVAAANSSGVIANQSADWCGNPYSKK